MRPPVRRRTRARELALQFLYTLELQGDAGIEELDAFVDHHTARGPDKKGHSEVGDYAKHLVRGVRSELALLNRWIGQIAENWRIERMAHIDRNVLRLAIFELLHERDVPFKVVINEAIDIAKRYSTQQSGSFVNGILDRARVLIEEARSGGDDMPEPPLGSGARPGAGAPGPMPEAPTPRPRPDARRSPRGAGGAAPEPPAAS
ncbi:MAG TPA: transcription antitermination factor NusB [Planctomycetota bacterium]